MNYRMLVEIVDGGVRVSDLTEDARIRMRVCRTADGSARSGLDDVGEAVENVADFATVVGAAVEIEARLEMGVEESIAWGCPLGSRKPSRRGHPSSRARSRNYQESGLDVI